MSAYGLTLTLGLVIGSAILSVPARPQSSTAQNPAALNELQKISPAGFPLSASTNVTGNVSVEAVLIPPKIARHVFGKAVGNNYATIEITISNRSADASLIVHSLFIDYSQWLLSGYSQKLVCSPESNPSSGQSDGKQSAADDNKPAQPGSTMCNTPQDWQSQTRPNQIASIEARVVRGELLDEQPWTNRNWMLRALVAAGSIAQAYSFTLSSQRAIQSIGAVNGQVVPAFQTFWPDSTVEQMNRISDFGFKVNKVIGKESSDIVVAFFPIDRFLTPSLKDIFMSSPAVFFSPPAMLVDPKVSKKLIPILQNFIDVSGITTESKSASASKSTAPTTNLLRSVATKNCGTSPDSESVECKEYGVLSRASLNTVRVVVGGIMTVDVNNIPAKIDSLVLDVPTGSTAADVWNKPGTITGVIQGSFLSEGQPSVAESDVVENVSAVQEGSTDKALHFKLTLKKAVSSPQKLTFKVTKKNSQGGTVDSSPFPYEVPAAAKATPAPAAGGTAPAAPANP